MVIETTRRSQLSPFWLLPFYGGVGLAADAPAGAAVPMASAATLVIDRHLHFDGADGASVALAAGSYACSKPTTLRYV